MGGGGKGGVGAEGHGQRRKTHTDTHITVVPPSSLSLSLSFSHRALQDARYGVATSPEGSTSACRGLTTMDGVGTTYRVGGAAG